MTTNIKIKNWWMYRAFSGGGELHPDEDILFDAVYTELEIELSDTRLRDICRLINKTIEFQRKKYSKNLPR